MGRSYRHRLVAARPAARVRCRPFSREVVSDGISLDARLLPKREPLYLSKARIDAVPDIFGLLRSMRLVDRLRVTAAGETKNG